MAMNKVSLNRRISTELVPKAIFSGFTPTGFGKRKPDSMDVQLVKPTGISKAARKKLKTERWGASKKIKVHVNGVEKLLAPRKFGYDSNGNRRPDPSSKRSLGKLGEIQGARAKPAGPPKPLRKAEEKSPQVCPQ